MKKLYTLLFTIFLFVSVQATVHTVLVSNNAFSPSTVNAAVGDTVRWQWVEGFHTTTSDAVPVGATAWNAAIDQSNTSFSKVVSVSGTYSYHCNFHTEMLGTIMVTPTGIFTSNEKLGISAFPNPAANRVVINYSGADVDKLMVYNITGSLVSIYTLDPSASKSFIDITDLESGVYFFSVRKGNVAIQTLRILKAGQGQHH